MTKLKICGACGGKGFTAFADETFIVGGETTLRGLSGERCDSCGEVYFDHASQDRYAQAGNALVLARRAAEQQLLLRVRKKLKLTQHQAAQLTGGGHNAFSRYERGQAQPMPAVVNLFKLLDKHPALLEEIR
ncbi:MAG: type II toxin-antitoxin system MqsA family antitoxin [Betaproteobacteria bacterium]|nr:type II toxin-antitoxin system MqsA family antitoxin [Betaproteobacteria bacterium]MCL2885244.1 type II toxin-antitoxin system MqsA family antitoxin [Betaproteobacteria bacterium]